MTNPITRWSVAVIGLAIGVLVAMATLGCHGTRADAALAFGIVATYTVALQLLRSRSDVALLLTGLPRDERWESINGRALALSAQVMAVVVLIAFLVTEFRGGDALACAWPGAMFAVAYLGGIRWYRAHS